MLKLKNRNRNRNRAKAARRAAVAAPRLSEQTVRELLIADSAPLRMTRAAAEYVRRAQPGDAWDVRDRLRSVGREEMCRGCFRPTFFLTGEERIGWLCAQCLQQRPNFAPSTLGLAELHVIDLALGTRDQGTADALMAGILDCQAVLCTECGSRFYVFAGQPAPHTCVECAEWHAEAEAAAELDRQEAELGRVRTACRWCNGEFFIPEDEPGPHSCWQCSYKDGF
jgi:hypothetical protein